MKYSTVWLVLGLVVLLGGFFALLYYDQSASEQNAEQVAVEEKAAAPPDLAEHREAFVAGVEALQRNDPEEAIEQLSSFSLAPRDAEQYRLYFLATAYQLVGKFTPARDSLARLWSGKTTLLPLADSGVRLEAMYRANGAWEEASRIQAGLATRALEPGVRGAGRDAFIVSKFHVGDPSAMLFAARNTWIDSPQAESTPWGGELIATLSGLPEKSPPPMSVAERLRRADSLIRDANPAAAVQELRTLEGTSPLQQQAIILARGHALQRLRRYQESDNVLKPIFSGYFKYAEPALLYSARNNRALAISIDPYVTKTVTERQRAGTRKVKVKGKLVNRPVYKNVKKQVKLVDLNRKKRKEEYERLYSERLKDILQIRSSPSARKEALTALIDVAIAKKQTAYIEELAPELARLDPLSEPGLQYLWDDGWAAYTKGDLNTARARFAFIVSTYQSPNVRRQATYWLAKILERSGEKERAGQLMQELVDVPYEDLYAIHAKRYGAKPKVTSFPDPFGPDRKDWAQIADESMPDELRLAYELTALGAARDARLEVQKNARDDNRKYADAIVGDLYSSEGATILAHRFVRRAFPQLATVEQDVVPPHFLRIYYPLKYEKEIREAAAQRKLDPYLVMALVHQESAFNSDIRSRVGATGLMQLMPATARELGNRIYSAWTESRLTNPEVNLDLGTRYLRWLLDRVGGSVELALASYNAGTGNVTRWQKANRRRSIDEFIESMPYAETRGYVKRIVLLRSSYERLHDSLSTPVRR